MSNIRVIFWGLLQALAIVLLSSMAIGIAVQLQKWESPGDGYLDILFLLLLFGTSALVDATVVLAYPAYLILQQRLREGFLLLLSTITWLILTLGGILTVIVFFNKHTIF